MNTGGHHDQRLERAIHIIPRSVRINSSVQKVCEDRDVVYRGTIGVNNASEETLSVLANGNQEYLDKFGYVFWFVQQICR